MSATRMTQYTDVRNVSYSYDSNGNLISKIDSGQTTTYQYNFENRLIKMISPEGTWEYIYDALGNRVAMIHNGIEHRYLVEPMGFGDVVTEYDGNGSLIARYVHGLGLISQIDASGHTYYYHFNPTGHTMEISDEDGNVVNSYRYSPFGMYIEKEENIHNPFGYVGEFGVMDDGNSLNYMRLRYYQPDTGRFVSEDPLMIPGGNRYGYTENNPIMFIDPIGMVNDKDIHQEYANREISKWDGLPQWYIDEIQLGGLTPVMLYNPITPWWWQPELTLIGYGMWYELYKWPAAITSFALTSYMELKKHMGFWKLTADITYWLVDGDEGLVDDDGDEGLIDDDDNDNEGGSKCILCGSTGKCVNCGGDGKCFLCDGDGICIFGKKGGRYLAGEWFQCSICGGDGTCHLCSATGECIHCSGSGVCLVCKGAD